MTEKIKKTGPGRPKKFLDLKQLEEYASQLLTVEQIATNLGVCKDFIFRQQRENEKVKEAIQRGRDRGITKVANKLVESALKGNTTAQIFILKTHGGPEWKEKQEVNLSSDQPISIKLVNDLKE